MIRIDQTIVAQTSQVAIKSPRLRMNYNFHSQASDPLQRMLNAVEPDTYIQPHKHFSPDKTEVFMVLRGRILVVEFDDDGVIIDFTVLSAEANCWGAEIPANTWHTIISLESGSVAYEVKDGPYIPITDKNFALWAPKEGDEGVQQYLKDIIQQCT